VNIGWLTLTLLLPFVGALATMAVPKAKALLA
jgi:NADH-quinone oxidoreductase subunit M